MTDPVIASYSSTASLVQTALFLMVLIPAVGLAAWIAWDISKPDPALRTDSLTRPKLLPVPTLGPSYTKDGVWHLHGVPCYPEPHELAAHCLCHDQMWHSCPSQVQE